MKRRSSRKGSRGTAGAQQGQQGQQEQQEEQQDPSDGQEAQQQQQKEKEQHPEDAGSSILEAASSVALELARCFQPPDSHLVQLLLLVSSAAVHIMASMLEAPRMPTVSGNSSGGTTSSSGSASGSSGSGQPRQGSTTSAQVQQTQRLVELREALVRLSLGVDFLMPSVPYILAHIIDADPPDAAAATPVTSHSSASSSSTTSISSRRAKQGACHSMHDSTGSIGPTSTAAQDNEQQTRLATLCTAWQQNLPPLATLTEAAVTTGVQS